MRASRVDPLIALEQMNNLFYRTSRHDQRRSSVNMVKCHATSERVCAANLARLPGDAGDAGMIDRRRWRTDGQPHDVA